MKLKKKKNKYYYHQMCEANNSRLWIGNVLLDTRVLKFTFLLSFSHVSSPFESTNCSPKNQISLRPMVLTTYSKYIHCEGSEVYSRTPYTMYNYLNPTFMGISTGIRSEKRKGIQAEWLLYLIEELLSRGAWLDGKLQLGIHGEHTYIDLNTQKMLYTVCVYSCLPTLNYIMNM